MSDGAQSTETAAPAPAAEGPKEIFVMGQQPSGEAKPAETTQAVEVKDTKVAGSEESKEGSAERDDKGRFKGNGVQERFDEMTRARRAAEREAEYWKIRAQGAPQAEPAQQPNQRPTREQFQDDEQYLDALADFKVDQKLAKRDADRQAVEAQTTKATSWVEKLKAARAEIADFDAVVDNNETPVASHVAELIMEHDHGAKVMHHMAANPDVVEKLNNLSPAKAAFEIAKLAAKFDVPITTSSKPAPEVSKAPPPAARTVNAGRSTEQDLGEMSMDDYIAHRTRQGASWAR